MKFLVTGGRGFIGSHFVEIALEQGHTIVDVDKMTYASNKKLPWDKSENYTLIKEDIAEIKHLPSCDVLINFAAESHVDNSIRDTDPFIKSNILGVHNLLELVRGKPEYDRPLFFHISTDEVYGDRLEGSFVETDKLSPSNPYSATKASAEMLVFSYNRTYGIDYIITRSANNYGERQYEEKLIPKCISSIENGKKIPVHGDGSYIRDWTYVKDNAAAILLLCNKWNSENIKNEIFNIAAENHKQNVDVVSQICEKMGTCFEDSAEFVPNRWGQDLRYSVSSAKIKSLGWKPEFENELYLEWIK
jgi:dTDP-glucose 4,6-dehydratase